MATPNKTGDGGEGTQLYGQPDLPLGLEGEARNRIALARETRTTLFALQNEKTEIIRPPHREMTVEERETIVSTTSLAHAFPVGSWIYFPLREGEPVPVDMLRQGVFIDEEGLERVLVLGQVTAHLGKANEVSEQASVIISLEGFGDRMVNYRRLLAYGNVPVTGVSISAEPDSSELSAAAIPSLASPPPIPVPPPPAPDTGALVDVLTPPAVTEGGTVIMTPLIPPNPSAGEGKGVIPPVEFTFSGIGADIEEAETQIMEVPPAAKILRLQQWLKKGKELYIERYGERKKIIEFEWPNRPLSSEDEEVWVKFEGGQNTVYSRWSFKLREIWNWNVAPPPKAK